MEMITVLYNMNTNKRVKKNKAMIKDFYIGRTYGCECQRCHKEVHGKDAFMHHLSSRTKKDNMANLWGTKAGEKEVKKTVLLCDDCHKALHSKYGKKVTIKQSKAFIYG